MQIAANEVARRSSVKSQTWQDLNADGQIVIQRVLQAISEAKATVADVGTLNSNVLFEVGFAIASEKSVMLCIDKTDAEAQRNWQEFGLLNSIGYTGYTDSGDLSNRFGALRPDLQESRLWEDLLVTGGVSPRIPRSLFFMPAGLRSDADKGISRILRARTELTVNEVGEEESGLAPLYWYSVNVYKSSAALIHLRGPQRVRQRIHNARVSFIAGLAAGLGLPLLMVAEENFQAPFDYQDLLIRYATSRHLTEAVDRWLDELPSASTGKTLGQKKIKAELPVANFGEYVAEKEQEELAEYFVETGEYQQVLSNQLAVFVGRKGTGKTANMLRAADAMRRDKRKVVVVIKPSGYELLTVLEVLAKLPRHEAADYLLDAIWQYLLYTEIALYCVQDAEERPAGIASGSPLAALKDYLQTGEGTYVDFGARLEKLVEGLLQDISQMPSGVADSQSWIVQRIYKGTLIELRRLIAHAIQDRDRVAVLIDNLDKAWERNADQEKQSHMILGLLGAVGKVEKELRKHSPYRTPTKVSLAVFLRADIFEVVRRFAREPDKISTLQIRWTDPELRARVIEDRYVSQRAGRVDPSDLWSELFCSTVKGSETRSYILERSLPRPRDLVFLCNAAALNAANRRHDRIEEEDIVTAESEYSSFAFDALLVEGSNTDELDGVLFEFAGVDSQLSWEKAQEMVASASTGTPADELMSILIKANFLGIEVNEDVFEYVADDYSERRARVMSRRVAGRTGRSSRVSVHPAFRPYLGILEK